MDMPQTIRNAIRNTKAIKWWGVTKRDRLKRRNFSEPQGVLWLSLSPLIRRRQEETIPNRTSEEVPNLILRSSSAPSLSGKKKRAQRLTFWVLRPPGGAEVFHAKGWSPKSSCPPSKVCLPWVSKGGIWDVLGFLPGHPGPWRCSKSLCERSSCAFFLCPFSWWEFQPPNNLRPSPFRDTLPPPPSISRHPLFSILPPPPPPPPPPLPVPLPQTGENKNNVRNVHQALLFASHDHVTVEFEIAIPNYFKKGPVL